MEDKPRENQPRLPPPQGYPTEENSTQASLHPPAPVFQSRETRRKKKSASREFMKGCMAAFCCCFMMDECCCDLTDLFVQA